MPKIVVGISGGVDSAVTASLLKAEGYEVVGVHIVTTTINSEEVERLNFIADKTGIPIEIIHAEKEFNDSVIAYFVHEHLAGLSPSPCAFCNPEFKWKILKDQAKKLGAVMIATGHYIQKTKWKEKWFLKAGNDDKKDQSYFLWGLDQEIIEMIHSPLGKITKEHTRKIAKELGLINLLTQKESMGLCFANKLSYNELLKKFIPECLNISTGKVMDIQGNLIGRHKGYIYYTVGQKKNIEFFDGIERYVLSVNPAENKLVAGPKELLWHSSFEIDRFKFVDKEFALSNTEIKTKIRGFGWNPEGSTKLSLKEDGIIQVELENPAWAIAPGQPAVFYYNDLLLGGGFIVK
ncbi:MAG: tRNA 2-thiouridine(34) synthase MnmA [Bacteroidales bacterium]|nr:tRNA 2-thiouridine(34) synthase MnmA [Bacteroidales bacterium]MBN2820735.1 tRNA 2-thiouridine(34) synthase MnmA [Bacteroidales bacterium]